MSRLPHTNVTTVCDTRRFSLERQNEAPNAASHGRAFIAAAGRPTERPTTGLLQLSRARVAHALQALTPWHVTRIIPRGSCSSTFSRGLYEREDPRR